MRTSKHDNPHCFFVDALRDYLGLGPLYREEVNSQAPRAKQEIGRFYKGEWEDPRSEDVNGEVRA